jgi:hypothetical protein
VLADLGDYREFGICDVTSIIRKAELQAFATARVRISAV